MKYNKTVTSWAFYDFANSAFTTLLVTFIYGAYFAQSICPNDILGTQLWSWSISITAIIVAISSPLLGVVADVGGYRKVIMMISTWLCILLTAFLFFPEPGDFIFAIILFTIANIAFEIGTVFYNAYLPEIAPKNHIGRVSGFAWGLGYLGGLVALLIALIFFIQPDKPVFGLTTFDGQNIRATNLLVAVWFFLFSLPFFIFIKDDRLNKKMDNNLFKASFKRLKSTFIEIKKYKNIYRFLIARLVYNDALITIFAFGGIYASTVIGFSFNEIILMGIVLNLTAGLGAYSIGFIDDRKGSVFVIRSSVLALLVACFLALIAPNIILISSFVSIIPDWIDPKFCFWCAAILIGFFAGPNQSASRSLMSYYTPMEKRNEFFGFYAFSGKATSFLGPLLFGTFTSYFGTQQAGIMVVFILFIIGYFLLKRI